MNELIDINPDVNVREEEYIRLLGYPRDFELEGRARELADWVRQWYNQNGKPWVYAVRVDKLNLTNEKLKIDDVEFASKKFRDQLVDAGTSSVMLAAVSAGKEIEEKSKQLWQEGKPDEYFFLEVYGSAVTEQLVTNAGARFCAWAEENNQAVLPHYSPGYPGWDVKDQINLLKLINQKRKHDLPGKMDVFETGMLLPKKSLLAVFGITNDVEKVRSLNELIPCETCSMFTCKYRRVPYKHARNPVENVSRLQSNKKNNTNSNGNHKTILDQNAKYSISIKALKKWSEERLKMNVVEDGSVVAKFKYEGTTCSNLGHTLEFEYRIELSPADEGYKIKSIACSPADEGYTFMCEYAKDPAELMKTIENEKPLLGKPLNDILTWKRKYNPEGCFCKPDSREHKWGLVFEVLHYKLVEYENQKSKQRIAFRRLNLLHLL